jgi:ribosomal protein S27E
MPFTTTCLACGTTFRLVDRYLGCKVMCPDCRKPFLAQRARAPQLEVDDGSEELPAEGWLVVCPSCGHTNVMADGPGRQTHCGKCGGVLVTPKTRSKPIRRKGRAPDD